MTRVEPDDIVQPPVDAVAQLLLHHARDDISLVRRTRGPAKNVRITETLPPVARQHDSSPLTLTSNTDLANKQYLEDLVSIAVASAERADSVLLEASATRAKAVRAICAFSSIGAVGVAVGVFGMVDFHGGRATADQKIVEIAGKVQSLDQQQELANHQLAAVRSEIADQRKTVTAIQQTAPSAPLDASDSQTTPDQRVIAVPGGQPIVATPLNPLREATYSAPWPEHSRTGQSASYSSSWPQSSDTVQATPYSSAWPARTEPAQPSWSARRRQPRVPQFLIAIQQNLRMLFR